MDELQLDDLVYTYPNTTDPLIQTKLTAKQEFYELRTERDENIPRRGEFFKHQLQIMRFLLIYDFLLMIHRAGTGKTCAVVGSAEMFKKALANAIADIITQYIMPKKTHIRHVFVLVRGPALRWEFANQIICRCSAPETYESRQVKNSKTERARRNNITRALNTFYTIVTYGQFAQLIVRNGYSNEQIRQRYSGCMFIVDEAHNLRIEDAETLGEEAENLENVNRIRDKQITYDTLHRVFHVIERSKVVLLTATPAVNDPSEMVGLMNLILPVNTPTQPNNQMPSNFDFDSSNVLQNSEPYYRGRISYVREMDTDVTAIYRGTLLPASYQIGSEIYRSQQIVYSHIMSDFQSQGYRLSIEVENQLRIAMRGIPRELRRNQAERERARERAIISAREIMTGRQQRGEIVSETEGASFRIAERQAANFVFPDGSSGPLGYRKYVVEESISFRLEGRTRGYTITNYKINPQARPELLPYINNLQNLRTLSVKYANIIEASIATQQNQFVFVEYIHGSGSIVLSLCYEALGFERFRERESVFVTNERDPGGLQPYCPSEEPSALRGSGPGFNPQRETRVTTAAMAGARISTSEGWRNTRRTERRMRINKARRFALFISTTSDPERSTILQTFNSYENRHGEYIQVLIVSPFGREGINTANVKRIDLMGGGWNQSLTYQALSRALRATSHVDLLEEERDRLRRLGQNPDDADVTVDIYQHAAVTPSNESADIEMYELSERKDIRIKKGVERPAKQIAFDCQLNRGRNIHSEDINGSATCDYGVCDYPCVSPYPSPSLIGDPTGTGIDYSSFDVLYSDEIVDAAVFDLLNIFSKSSKLNVEEIYRQMSLYREEIITLALEKAISEKVQFRDRFGYRAYLREEKGIFFLTRDFPVTLASQKQDIAYYSNNLIAIDSKTIRTFVNIATSEDQESVITEILNLPPGTDLTGLIAELTLENQIALLERSVVDFLNGISRTAVLDYFHLSLFTTQEPTEEIEKEAIAMSAPKVGRGRPPKGSRQTTPARITPLPQGTKETIYFHNLLEETDTQGGYGKSQRSRNVSADTIRILKPSERSSWRDATPYENPVYNRLIFQVRQRRLAPFEQYELYGTLLKDGEFRLAGKLRMTQQAIESGESRRLRPGTGCENESVPRLINYVHHLRVLPPDDEAPEVSRNEMINFTYNNQGRSNMTREFLSNMDNEKLRYYYKYIYNDYGKERLCRLLRETLTSLNRVYIA